MCLSFLKIRFLHIQSLQVLFRVIHVGRLSFSTEAQNEKKMAPVGAIFEFSYIVVFLAATVGVKVRRGVSSWSQSAKTLLDVIKCYSHLTLKM